MLNLSSQIADPDALFAALVAAHDGLDERASRLLDARLVLLLANHVGDQQVVLDAIRLARKAVADHAGSRP
ncbi:MAG: DUF2783 domain-containing protein [Acetobacteraceae bacterium]|nr:DUF2783 domain-containing protein [Acetobacteraceae bacterium]